MSQRDDILTHLKKGGGITPITALNQYGCFRLAARIEELRASGHRINTKMEKKGDKRYARYFLEVK